MPTEYHTFSPPAAGPPFQFQATLDGGDYLATVKWNTFANRWYISLDTTSGVRIFNQALVGSQPHVDIESVTWDNGFVTMKSVLPHSFRIGDTNYVWIRGCQPVAYNGRFLVYATDLLRLVYPLSTPPGNCVALGHASYDINLAGLYFRNSTLVYRAGSNQFEVFNP